MNAAEALVEIEGALDPFRDLEPGEIEHLYVETPDSPSPRIAGRLRRYAQRLRSSAEAIPAPHHFVCGARGCGKTTQILRLEWTLRDTLSPLRLDLGSLQPTPLSTRGVLAVIGIAVLARLRAAANLPAGSAEVVDRFRQSDVFTTPESDNSTMVDGLVEAVAGLLSLTPSSTAQGVGKALPYARRLLRSAQAVARVQPLRSFTAGLSTRDVDAAQLLRDVNDLLGHLQASEERPILLLVDGLDKARGPDEAMAAFDQVELLTDLVAPLVLTGPAQLQHHASLHGLAQEVYVEPAGTVPIVTRDGRDRLDDIARVERMLRARVPAPHQHILTDEAVRSAARGGAGLPRDSLLLLQGAVGDAADAQADDVRREHVEAAIRRERIKRQATITASDLTLLRRVLDEGRVGQTGREHELLFNNFIVLYANGQAWFRPHAILVDWIEEERRLAAQRAADRDDEGPV